jgi:seryl-tRNA synthetase
LFISVHSNHPRELTTETRDALGRLADAGIPLGNQSVLLKHVNDDPEVLRALLHKLLMCRVRPYYLYQCDLISGSAHLRTSVRRGLEIMEKLRGHGFEPVIPPVLVKEEALFGTGFLPDTEQQIYRLADDPLYLTGTSEVPLASLHAGEIMDEVPRRYAGFSPCFRREAGAAGKDTRGIFRVHQFDKVEMFAFVEPQDAVAEHDRLLAIEEEIWQGLQVPYRVVNIAVDDLGNSAVKKYDIEAWLPSQQRFREVTSTSNTTDFQSRRLDIRYRPDGGKPTHVHTLNGTAVAVSRALIALMENHQTDDGGVEIPQVLQEWGAPARLG